MAPTLASLVSVRQMQPPHQPIRRNTGFHPVWCNEARPFVLSVAKSKAWVGISARPPFDFGASTYAQGERRLLPRVMQRFAGAMHPFLSE